MAVSEQQQHLDWEARRRFSAAGAAVVASIFTLAGAVGTGMLFGDAPRAGFAASLEHAAQPGPLGPEPSLRTPFYEYYQDHSGVILAYSGMRFIGLLALGWALTYLAIATRARRPAFPKFAVPVPMIGATLSGIAALMYDLSFRSAISDFLAGPRTVDRAEEITNGSALMTAQFIGLPGALGLSIGFVLVSLNAMRAGLLTRFMGVLGVIVGVLIIFPLGSPLPIVQCFWLAGLAVLIAGRWPNGVPPAWRTGNAEPWPTAAEVRAARVRDMERRRGGGGDGEPESADDDDNGRVRATVPSGTHPSSKKRKRKRRD